MGLFGEGGACCSSSLEKVEGATRVVVAGCPVALVLSGGRRIASAPQDPGQSTKFLLLFETLEGR